MKRAVKVFLSVVVLLSLLALGIRPLRKSPEPKETIPPPKTWSQFKSSSRLAMLIQGFGIRSVLDLPCTDLSHLAEKNLGFEKYLGVTSSKGEARALQIQYGSEHSSFLHLDPTRDIPPRVDLILCWDYLAKLSESEVRACIYQIKKSGARFILLRNYPDTQTNSRENSLVNWRCAPYHFPKPILQISEQEHSTLALWTVESLP